MSARSFALALALSLVATATWAADGAVRRGSGGGGGGGGNDKQAVGARHHGGGSGGSGGSGGGCVIRKCQNHVYQCGDCIDNDGDGKIDDQDSEILVEDGEGFPLTNGRLLVGNELVSYDQREGNRFLGVRRGLLGGAA